MRQIKGDSEMMLRNIVASLARAKEALEMDLSDPVSWYVLGNAYMTIFFKASFNDSDIDKALQAYARSEQLGGENNPDLFFNRGNVLMFKERYQEAAQAYTTAMELDPSLPSQNILDDIEHWMSRVEELYSRKGKVKAKKLLAMAQGLKEKQAPTGMDPVLISELQPGINGQKAVHLRMIMPIGSGDNPPSHFLGVDGNTDVVVLSIYHVDKYLGGSLISENVLTIVEPKLVEISFTKSPPKDDNPHEVGSLISYKCIQVTDPRNILTDDTRFSRAFALPVMDSNFFDK